MNREQFMIFKRSIDDKTRERALLLMRFYWLDDIYNIGKNLCIPYFDQFPNYWDIGYGDDSRMQAALAIAEAMSDEVLVKLTTEKPPKYGLDLGGFQGNYYTCDQSGRLKLESSWNIVRMNVEKALNRWGDKAYGILRGIINKGGRSEYFELLDAIESALGYEYIPSYLLPRFRTLKLIFKTGSNRYPDWTMPAEIIPVVEAELANYEKNRRPVPKKDRTTPGVFISYSSKDSEFVERLANDLSKSVKRVWWDRWEIKVGDSITSKINEGIDRNDYLILVLSPNSVESSWVQKELNAGLMRELQTRNVVVLPILIGDCDIPPLIADKRYADFRASYEQGLAELLPAIQTK